MKNQQSFSKQCINDCFKNDYGTTVSALTNLNGGADLNAAVYNTETVAKTIYFVKLKQELHHNIGILLQLLLHNAGIKQIIFFINTIGHKLSKAINDFTLIVSIC
ncbi:MAG: hypothetical protein WCD44_04780 [Candidatus Babeliales bacterium]